jgi:opacity protein-like surface antigen
MARAFSLALLFLCLAPVVKAQETPQYQVFVGPSYAREDLTDIKFINGIGWHASLDGTANSWLSAVFDFSGYYSSPKVNVGLSTPIPINSSDYLYLAGPRFTYRKWQRLTPFAEALLGASTFRFTASRVGLTNAVSSTAFAAALGGGVDYAVNRRFAIRIIEADYVVTRSREISVDPTTGEVGFNGPRRTQNNARASAGVVFRFGSR